MVSYQKFVQIAFRVARDKGAQFDGIEDGGDFMSELGTLWSVNRDQYKQLTELQMRNELETVVTP